MLLDFNAFILKENNAKLAMNEVNDNSYNSWFKKLKISPKNAF